MIKAEDFIELVKKDQNLNILDIRSDLEYKTLALDYPVTHIPLHQIDGGAILKTDEPTYILCKAGPRAEKCAEYLKMQGHQNLIVIDGGITKYKEYGGAIKYKRDDITMEQIQQAIQDSVQKFMAKITL